MLDRFFHYSFLDGRLIGSEHPAAVGHERQIVEHFVRERGVRALITLIRDANHLDLPELRQYHVPILGVPSRSQVERAVAHMAEHLRRSEGVWVHCQRGIDRTGCVIGCYLVSIGRSPENVINELLTKFPRHRQEQRFLELWQPYADIIRGFSLR